MRRFLLDISTILFVGLVALLVWLGQQRTPDLYLQAIQQRGVLRVGMDPTYPPFDTLQNGQPSGYDVALARAIASDLGVRLQVQTFALDTLYDALAAGKVDMLISALPFVYERQKDVRYSQPYYQAGQVILVRAGTTDITSAASLQSRKVGVELGSAADTEARRLARSDVPGLLLRSDYHSPDQALSALVKGDVDAVITDNPSAQAWQSAHPGSVSVLSPPLTSEPYVVAMPVRATGLSSQVDTTIARLRSSGELARMMGEGK